MKYNPLHPHCGPLNSVNESPSIHVIDEACRVHDMEYGKMGAKAYRRFSYADQDLLDRLYEQWPRISNQAEREAVSVYIAWFEGKKATNSAFGLAAIQESTPR